MPDAAQSTRVRNDQEHGPLAGLVRICSRTLGGNPAFFCQERASATYVEKRGRERPCCAVDGKLIEEREQIPIELKASLEVRAPTGVERPG
jgi:hypothetical protein